MKRLNFSFSFLVFVTSLFAQEAKELRLGYFPNVTHAQALIARANGGFEKKIGIPIQWTSFNAGPTAIESILTDSIDATFVGPNPTINGYMRSHGSEFVIISGSASGGAGLVVRKDSGIKSDKDFANKTIATPQYGNTQDVAARTWFKEKGYQLRDHGGNLTIVPLSNPDQLTMFHKKQIDGAWTIEPWMSRLEVEGGGEVFMEEKTLWPEGKYITTLLIVRKTYLTKNKATVKKLLQALVETTQQIQIDPKTSISTLQEQLKKETGKALKDEVMQKAMNRVEFTWDPVAFSLVKSANAAHLIGIIKNKPDLKGIYSLDLLNEALREKNLPVVSDK